MKRIKRIIAVTAALVMTVAIGAAFVGCGDKDTRRTIAVIAKGETHAFWQAVKAGAEQAGEKYGYKITFRGPADETADSIAAQREMVSSALALKPAGIALATIGAGFGPQLKEAFDAQIPVVEFDSGIHTRADIDANKSPIVSAVATSNTLAAGIAGTKLFESVKADIAKATTAAKYKVGIIQHDTSRTGIDRAAGFRDALEAAVAADPNTVGKLEITETVIGVEKKYKDAANTLLERKVQAIFMCNEGVVKEIYAEVATNDKFDAIKFVGYDAGTAQINWMKNSPVVKAVLIGSVAQNSVQIGYQAVEQVAKALNPIAKVDAEVKLAGAWWDKANVDQMIKDNLVYEG